MRPVSRVVTKKEIGRKRIIQVGLTRICGLGRFPGHTTRCRASGRLEARMCVVTEREGRGRARGAQRCPSLQPTGAQLPCHPSPPGQPKATGQLPIFLTDTFYLCQQFTWNVSEGIWQLFLFHCLSIAYSFCGLFALSPSASGYRKLHYTIQLHVSQDPDDPGFVVVPVFVLKQSFSILGNYNCLL